MSRGILPHLKTEPSEREFDSYRIAIRLLELHPHITERLRSARGEPAVPIETANEANNANGHQNGAVAIEDTNKIATTSEELEAYYIVKAITCAVIEAERIVYRNSQTYFSILSDDNNRRPICRLHFNGKQKFIGLLDANHNEERIPIAHLNEIYQLADRLRSIAGAYVKH